MNLTKFNQLIALGLVLSAAAVGCQTKHPTPLTKLPGSSGDNVPDPNLAKGDTAGTADKGADSTNALANNGGIPSNPAGSHDGWTQNRDQFQADTVHFEYDSSVVKSSEKAHVSAVADYLKANGATALLVEGHCDERGTEEYNRALGERRALSLREELARLGVDPSRVDTISYGKDRPVDTGRSEASHRKNRRGEFVLLTNPNPR